MEPLNEIMFINVAAAFGKTLGLTPLFIARPKDVQEGRIIVFNDELTLIKKIYDGSLRSARAHTEPFKFSSSIKRYL